MNNLFIFLITITLLINITLTESIKTLSDNDKDIEKQSKKDKNYLIFVNNTYGDFDIFKHPKNIKRHEIETYSFVNSLVDTIDELIIENKDTYKNPEKLEEIEKQDKWHKRNIEGEEIYTYDNSKFVHVVSSVKDRLVLTAYLSNDLVESIKEIDNVFAVIPDSKIKPAENKYYNESDILEETKWNNVTVKKTDNIHLTLISQGINNGKLVDEYDQTYYYPSSGGKDINIFILDNSFNFKNSEFSNTDERYAQCLAFFVNNTPYRPYDIRYCGNLNNNHGQIVSDMAGGIKYGAAPLANIYGVAIPEDDGFYISDVFLGLNFISNDQYKFIIRHRTIINLSMGAPGKKGTEEYNHYQEIIDDITEKGAIVVVSAGNDINDVGSYLTPTGIKEVVPCVFNSTICVGGIESSNDKYYENNYKVARNSNYGKDVDIYAPFNVVTEIYDYMSEKQEKSTKKGTSFSAPLTSGVIATIMSDHPETKFTKTTMLEYLLKNALPFYFNDEVHYILNNGKHTVYSGNNKYYGCGTGAGNLSCEESCLPDSCNLIESKKSECKLMNGLLIYDTKTNTTDVSDYACIVISKSKSTINKSNSVCFEDNNKTKCIYDKSTSFKECQKENKHFDSDICNEKVSNLMEIAYNSRRQEKHRLKCENEDGIFLTDDEDNYICLSHYHGLKQLAGKYCVLAESHLNESIKRVYCINNYYSNLSLCSSYMFEMNKSKCYKKIVDMASDNLYDINIYLANPDDLY